VEEGSIVEARRGGEGMRHGEGYALFSLHTTLILGFISHF